MAASHAGELRTAADRLLAAAFGAVAEVEIWVFGADADFSATTRVTAALLALGAACSLAIRRSRPVLAYWINGLAVIGLIAADYPSDVYQWTNLVAIYSIAAHGTARHAWLALPAAVGGVLFYFWRFPFEGGRMVVAFAAALWVVAWLSGRMYGARLEEARLRHERDLSRQLAAVHEDRLAVEKERTRIARELHDIIGHTVNVMVVHAGAGGRAVDDDPTTARHAFGVIEEIGRSAMAELDRVLAVLHGDGAAADLRPPPGIGELTDLAATFTDAGLAVDVRVSGNPASVPGSAALATYRIVQEALTNAIKHASADAAEVHVAIDARRLDLRVVDNGAGAAPGFRAGRGIAGMTERAAMHGGSLTTGTAESGGFVVTATLAWDAT